MKKKYIIISSILVCIMLYFIEQVIGVNYGIKTFSKIIMFTLVPYIYFKIIKNTTVKNSLNYKNNNRKNLKVGFILGILSFFIILIGYYFIGKFINFNAIALELGDKSKITSRNFIFVGIYITLFNSFLEEFFFRGFIFLNLYELNYKKFAYGYSSVLFAIYHISIFKTWFNPIITFLALFGLIVVGVVFNLIDTKSKNFINSWILHILADSAIILIGFKIFKIF